MTGGCAVILGRIGRNFAAGMSGGIAYVWNPKGNADYYINMDLVELTIPSSEKESAELRDLIERHHKATGSHLAARMLADWDSYFPQFLKVTPVEYKKFLS